MSDRIYHIMGHELAYLSVLDIGTAFCFLIAGGFLGFWFTAKALGALTANGLAILGIAILAAGLFCIIQRHVFIKKIKSEHQFR